MAAKLEKTRHPGIYKRGSRYVVAYRDGNGKPRRDTVGTVKEALRVKAARTTDVARGEFHAQTRMRFREYAGGVGRAPPRAQGLPRLDP
jgi:hypothetical protein